MHHPLATTVRRTLIALLIIALGGYTAHSLRPLMTGPSVRITEPAHGSVVTEPLVRISGTAEGVAEIRIHGRDIVIDNTGAFEDTLLLARGYNILEVVVIDRFGRRASAQTAVIYR